jgi:SAM-dependent methyltransferase
MDLKEEAILGDSAATHWYYRAKSAAMLRMLGPAPIGEILDVGAGSGFFSRVLLDRTGATGATCVDPNYAREHNESHNAKPIRFVFHISQFSGNLVLMMDVLEHVPDDTALLGQYAARVAPGTRFLITVPALQWMWSGHDVFLEHYRRYTLPEVDSLIARVGLKKLSSSYYFGLTLPIAAAARLPGRIASGGRIVAASGMKRHSPLVNATLGALCAAELPLLGHNKLAGLSVFALAEK